MRSILYFPTSKENKRRSHQDEILSRAIIRSFEVIGEASNKLDRVFKETYPAIEWKKMSGTRNRLIHDYLGVDDDIIWNVIVEKLPLLQEEIDQILHQG